MDGRRVLVAGTVGGDVELVAACVRARGATVVDDAATSARADVCLVTRSAVTDRLVPLVWVPFAAQATVGVHVQSGRLDPTRVDAWVERTLGETSAPPLVAPHRLELPRQVRDAVRGCWPTPDRLDTVLLAASELASNAVQHASATPAARVSCDGGRLLIEAIDDRPLDLPCLADPEATHPAAGLGHGLRIVAAVADRWGVTVRPTCKIVWCEFDPPRV